MKLVLGEGSLDSKIVLVGEAPGVQEEACGRPFVGPAGKELLRIMHTVGLARSDCYITNVIKEHPPRDDINKFIRFGKYGEAIETEEFKKYKEQLKHELMLCKANVIVALGNVPLYTLTGKTAITKRRGSIYESTLVPKRKVLACIHPSSALRKYIHGMFIRMDLRKAIRESDFPEIILPVRDIKIKPTFPEVMHYLDNIKSMNKEGDLIAFDIEVVNEEVSCISFAKTPTDVMSIPFIFHGTDYFNPDQELDIWLMIASILEDERIKKVGQNLIFDCSFLYRKMGIKVRNVEDTMIIQAIMYPDFPKGLDFITSMWTSEPYYKDEGKKWFKIGGSETDFWIYNAKDSAICREVFPKQAEECKIQGNIETYKRQVALVQILVYMQERGLRVDVDGMRNASVEADEKIVEMMKELSTITNRSVAIKMETNPDVYKVVSETGDVEVLDKASFSRYCKIYNVLNTASAQQLSSFFYGEKRIQPYYKDGKVTTDEMAMKRIARKGVREAEIIRDIRKLKKLKGTYFDINLSKDNRLRSSMNPVGTKNGRLSSSEDIFGEGSNIQNLPDAMKKFVIADEGMVLYEIDLSQGENRIVAYIAPEPLMKEAFEQGKDVHSLTASLISGIPADEIKRQDKEGIKCPLGTGEYTMRFWGKKANHGLNYDLGYKSFAIRYDMQESEAKYIVERYHQVYPGIRQYHAWIRAMLQTNNRKIVNPYGRARIYLDRWGDELFKEAYNFIPQSTVADIIIKCMLHIYYNQHLFEHVDILNQVHDSIIFQIPKYVSWNEHARILIDIKKKLEEPVPWHTGSFIIPVDISMCANLGKKGRKEVRVDETNPEGLANELSRIYEELRTSGAVQVMDWDFSDSSVSSEESVIEMGDV